MKLYRVMMVLGCPPLPGRDLRGAREVAANYDPLPEAEARVLLAEMEGCVGTSGIGVDSLTLIAVSLREVEP